jgi:hypothetical protein
MLGYELPPLPYRVDNEVLLQGSGRSLAGADSDDHQASMRGIGRADRIRGSVVRAYPHVRRDTAARCGQRFRAPG